MIESEGTPGAKAISERDKILFPENRFYVPNNITADNLNEIIVGLRNLETAKPGTNVMLEINTTGGDTLQANALALAMYHSRLHIATLATEVCHSAGIKLAAAGMKGSRFAYPQTEFIIHSPSYKVEGKFTAAQLRTIARQKTENDNRYISFLSELTGRKANIFEEIYNMGEDCKFGSDEAIKLGIIDHIIPNPKRG